MRIREYTANDLDALRRLHAAQGFGYPFPDLDSPLFVTKLVLEDTGEDLPDENSDAQGREEPHRNPLPESFPAAAPPLDSSPRHPGLRDSLPRDPGLRDSTRRDPGLRDSTRRDPGRIDSEPHDSEPRDRRPRIAMAVLLRLTAEAYLLHDPAAGTPRQRWQRFLALHAAAQRSAAARGLDDAQAFLPPRVARAFGRRLARLGWSQDPWPCFSKRVE